MGPAYRLQAVRIRQAQIEYDDINDMPSKMRLGIAHARDVRYLGADQGPLVQHFLQQPSVARIVFDQQKHFDWFLAHATNLFWEMAFLGWPSERLSSAGKAIADFLGFPAKLMYLCSESTPRQQTRVHQSILLSFMPVCTVNHQSSAAVEA